MNFLVFIIRNRGTNNKTIIQIKFRNKNVKKGITTSNKRYTLRRLFGGSGLHSPRSHTFPRLIPPTFLQPWSCYASPYTGCKNVIYLER